MDWCKLLSKERFFWPRDLPIDEQPSNDESLDVFQVDCSRITLSAPFHRLQRKTQVLPFPKTDYPRTRLTHTNEVSDCGRQIARIVARELSKNNEIRGDDITSIEDIVAAACKGHDIGNPPFGHAGEFAIQRWIEKNTTSPRPHAKTTGSEVVLRETFRREMLSFDGNAQGFRLLTETTGWRRKGGLQLTCAVLGAFSKYPWGIDYAKSKKFGVLESSSKIARYIYEECGLVRSGNQDGPISYCRHPLAYIVEAADDISYLTADLEDAVKSKVIPVERAYYFLEKIAKDAIESREARKALMHRADKVSEGDGYAKLRYLKDHAQRAMKIAAAQSFIYNYKNIIDGSFEGDLISKSGIKNICIEIKDYFRNEVYDDIGKTRNEIFGARVIDGLLDFFFEALFSASADFEAGNNINEIIRKRLGLFPLDNYFPPENVEQHNMCETIRSLSNEDMAQMVVDYVSGMTDTYATDIYQQLHGLQRPSVSW